MKTITKLLIAALIAWCAVCAAKPYWHRYWLGIEVEAAAIYGTKNSIKDTKQFLAMRMVEEEYSFTGDDFYMEKDEKNSTLVRITYLDEIAVFGFPLVSLEFTIEKTAKEVDQVL